MWHLILDIAVELFSHWFWTRDHEARWWVWALLLFLIVLIVVLLIVFL